MPHLITTRKADAGIDRCIQFLIRKNPLATRRAAEAIWQGLKALETTPDIGSPSPGFPGRRELSIKFGTYGYKALYRHDEVVNTVYVLAFRHQREGAYR